MSDNSIFELIRACDLFPKMDTSYLDQSRQGGMVSMLAFTIISYLCLSELWYYKYAPAMTYEIEADAHLQEWIHLTFRMTIATPCEQLVVAKIDSGGQKTILMDELKREELVSEAEGRSLCRISGEGIRLNRINGKMAILPVTGLVLGPLGRLLVAMDQTVNFSHQIEYFSFNETIHQDDTLPGVVHPILGQDVNPLRGMKRVNIDHFEHVKYKLSVITTRHHCPETDRVSKVQHEYGVSGYAALPGDPQTPYALPGIYFEYELEPLSVAIRRDPEAGSVWSFSKRVLGIISGVFMCSGLLHHVVNFIFRKVYLPSRNRVIYQSNGIL